RVARSSSWWWPFKGAAILTERPELLQRDPDGRLHCESGPSLRYPDGFSLWSIHGVRVDEQVILTPQTQTIEQIRNEQNEEIRRIRIERFAGSEKGSAEGWQKYLCEVGATVLDRRRNDIEGTREVLYRSAAGEVLLVTHCPSTARVYALERPKEIKTCEQAQAWGWSGSWLDRLKMKRQIVGRT